MSQQSIDQARVALEVARRAKADMYAQAEFEQAESLLKSAVKRFEVGNVLKARVFAETAKTIAGLALHLALKSQVQSITPLEQASEKQK